MKCLVCGKNYEAAECPRCRFPDVQIIGDREQTIASLKPTIDAWRTNFLQAVQVKVQLYRWKDKDGMVVLDRVDTAMLGDGNTLRQGAAWLPERIARIAEAEEISVTTHITIGADTREFAVTVPNLHRPELQQLGASVDEEFNLRLMLRNASDAPTCSEPVPLFDEK